jgi:kinetochore protein Nuf2
MEILEHPEIHRDSTKLLSLFKLMLNLLPNIGIEDFGLQDLIKPDPGRYRRYARFINNDVHRILSGLINFIKFREDRNQFFERCTAESEAAVESGKNLEKRNVELNAKVAHIKYRFLSLSSSRQIRAAQEPAVQKIKEANAALNAEITAKQKYQKLANEEIEGVKYANKERATMLQNIKCSLESNFQEITLLKSRIVHNPEQLKHVSAFWFNM